MIFCEGSVCSLSYTGLFSRHKVLRYSRIDLEPQTFSASKIGLLPVERISPQKKIREIFSLSNPRIKNIPIIYGISIAIISQT